MSESLKDALSEIVFSCRVLSQAREATIAEIDGLLSGPIADALATAYARGRRDMAEEAAKVAEVMPEQILAFYHRPGGPPGNGYRATQPADYAFAIRALVANTPEPAMETQP